MCVAAQAISHRIALRRGLVRVTVKVRVRVRGQGSGVRDQGFG